jgi:hypothetical protein
VFFKPPKLATPSSVATVACRRAAVRLTPPAGILSGARLFAPRDLIKAAWLNSALFQKRGVHVMQKLLKPRVFTVVFVKTRFSQK